MLPCRRRWSRSGQHGEGALPRPARPQGALQSAVRRRVLHLVEECVEALLISGVGRKSVASGKGPHVSAHWRDLTRRRARQRILERADSTLWEAASAAMGCCCQPGPLPPGGCRPAEIDYDMVFPPGAWPAMHPRRSSPESTGRTRAIVQRLLAAKRGTVALRPQRAATRPRRRHREARGIESLAQGGRLRRSSATARGWRTPVRRGHDPKWIEAQNGDDESIPSARKCRCAGDVERAHRGVVDHLRDALVADAGGRHLVSASTTHAAPCPAHPRGEGSGRPDGDETHAGGSP